MLVVKVAGGTSAGRKRPLHPPKPWTCRDGHDNKAYASRCLTTGCLEKRPPDAS